MNENPFHHSENSEHQVQKLEHFPCKSYDDFIEQWSNGKIVGMGVDRMIALRWMTNGKFSTTLWSHMATLLQLLPWLTYLGFIVVVVVLGKWLLLLALPLFFLLFFISTPSAAHILGILRTGILCLLIGFCAYGLFTNSSTALLLTTPPLIAWASIAYMYSKAGKLIRRAAAEHEELLCILWKNGVMNLGLENGVRYWNDFYTLPDGKMVSRKKKEDQ